MKKCNECGKRLGFLRGFCHPVKGKNFLLCSTCFDSVYESVLKWREAHVPYVDFFKNNRSEKTLATNKNFEITKIPGQLIQGIKMFESFWTEREI
jgi:hypothetical protein